MLASRKKQRDVMATDGTNDAKADTGAMLFVAPALALMLFVLLVPIGYVFYFALTQDGEFTLAGFLSLWSSGVFYRVLLITLQISLLATAFSVLLGYPVALHLSRMEPRWRAFYLAMVLLPFWTSI